MNHFALGRDGALSPARRPIVATPGGCLHLSKTRLWRERSAVWWTAQVLGSGRGSACSLTALADRLPRDESILS